MILKYYERENSKYKASNLVNNLQSVINKLICKEIHAWASDKQKQMILQTSLENSNGTP